MRPEGIPFFPDLSTNGTERLTQIKEIYGPDCIRVINEARRSASSHYAPTDSERTAVNGHFFNWMQREFPFVSPEQAPYLYIQQLIHANRFFSHIRDMLGTDACELELLNQTTTFSDEPIERLIVANSGFSSDVLRHQTSLQLYLGLFSLYLSTRMAQYRVRTRLNDIQYVLDHEFFQGGSGDCETVDVWTIHHSETNEVIYPPQLFEPRNADVPPQTRLKKRRERIQLLQNDFDFPYPVQSKLRKKADWWAICKMIEKARARNLFCLNPSEVKDMVGIKFIPFGCEHDQLDRLIEICCDTLLKSQHLQNHYGDINIEDREPPGKRRGQNPNIAVYRKKVIFNDAPEEACIELAFQTDWDSGNEQYEIGKMKGYEYDGRAHALYRLRRLRHTLPVLFPPSVYGSIDVEKLLAEQHKQTALQLLKINSTRVVYDCDGL